MTNRMMLQLLVTLIGLSLAVGCGGGKSKPQEKDIGDVSEVSGDIEGDADVIDEDKIDEDKKVEEVEVKEIKETIDQIDTTDVVEPKECTSNDDCGETGLCVSVEPGSSNKVCVPFCEGGCPDGWECVEIQGPDGATSVCLPPIETICQVCTTDSDCLFVGALCIKGSGNTGYCGQSCEEEGASCPTDFSCQEAKDKEGNSLGFQCMPLEGTCCVSGKIESCDDGNPCTVDYCDGTLGCQHSNFEGACSGDEPCTEYKCVEGKCTGIPITTDYTMDGIDDDCDGVVDDDWAFGLNVPHYWFLSTQEDVKGQGWTLKGSLSVPGVSGVVSGGGMTLTPVTVKLQPEASE